MKNKLIIICSLIIAFTVCFLGTVNASENFNEEYDQDETYLERNWERVQLASEIEKKIMEYYQISDVFDDMYPSYFGGLYISDDAKNLIIQIVEKNIPDTNLEDYKIYKEITTLDDSIMIEYVDYSFNELNDANNQLSDMTMDYLTENTILGNYIDVKNNTVVVEQKDNSIASQGLIKRQLNKNNYNKSKLITFITGDYSFTYAKKVVNVGGAIGNGNFCSMGFRTRYHGYDGFVTAGHCVKNLATIREGVVKYVQYSNNQKYDFAYVQTYSDYVPSNNLEHPEINIMTLANTKSSPKITVNMAIAKVGNTTKYTSGKVTGLNQSVTYKDDSSGSTEKIYGLVKSNLKSGKGDSGGAVFIPRKDSEGGSILVGILSGGGNGFLGLGKSMYFTSINDIFDPFQTGRY